MANLSIGRSMMQGSIGFAAVSVAGFAVWALGGRWLYRHVGEAGLYVACAVVFVGLAGVLMHPLVRSERPVRDFYRSFIPAFLAYAFTWSVCWFAMKFGMGEWLASWAGTFVFTMALRRALGSTNTASVVATVLFLCHTAGYFLGSAVYSLAQHPPPYPFGLAKSQIGLFTKLGWGLCYGLGFGAGIGYAYARLQKTEVTSPPPER